MRVLLFVKYPGPGNVKTRLAEHVGLEHAAGLYRAFVHDELHMLQSLTARITIFCAPEFELSQYAEWLPGHDLRFQRGATLGERMLHALRESLTENERVLLIGSDLPDLPGAYLQQAWHELERSSLCFGAAADGGFYLIGATRQGCDPRIFTGVRWSTSEVLEQTLANCRNIGCHPAILPSWPDIDSLADLHAFLERQTQADQTRAYLQANNLERSWKS